MIFLRVVACILLYMLIGILLTGWCLRLIGEEKANKYEYSTITFVILLWPVIVCVIIAGIITGLALKIGKK